MILRDYQTRDYAKIASALCASSRVLYVSPTGSGKTALTCQIVRDHANSGERVGFVAHRKELIDQCSQRLTESGIAHGVIMSGVPPTPGADVQVCSIQTLIRREPPQFDLAVIDEAHHAPSDSYQRFAAMQASVLGLTASPCRKDGRALGDCFDRLVIGSTVKELTSAGWLVSARVFAPSSPDLGGIHSRGGDYVAAELQTAMDRPQLTGNIVSHWLRLAKNRTTVAFASGVKHSISIVNAFNAAGVPAAHIDASTPKDVREQVLRDLAARRLLVVSNCGILTEGWDCPAVSCVILARPTKSLALFLQMCGRILRPAPGKTDCLILDHAGATLRHGFVSEDREWSLDGTQKPRAKDDSPSVRLCLKCYMAYESSLGPCPECGFAPPVKAREVREADGELTEITTVKTWSRNPQIAMLQKIQRERGYKAGWLFHQIQRLRRGQRPEIPHERNKPRKARSYSRLKDTRRSGVAAEYRRRLQPRRSRPAGQGSGRAACEVWRPGRGRHHRHLRGRRPAGDRMQDR